MALFNIKDIPIHSRVMLAPMAGITDAVFRALVRRWAPQSLICTEMISANGLIYSKQRKAKILDHTDCDRPIAYQLSSHRPEVLLEAAKQVIEDHQPETIDLNMGCPVKKITGNFEGCALMKEPQYAADLVRLLVSELETPVTVKFRLGWDHNSMNYLDFGRRLEDAGVSMVTLHARTRAQGYQPGCKWEAFGELKQALSIPVIANGDINSVEDVRFVLDTYGVDGVMIGRHCQGQPWIIGEIHEALETGKQPEPWPIHKRLEVAMLHAKALSDYQGPAIAIREMRKHFAWYAQSFPGVRAYRNRLTQVNSLDEVQRLFDEILSGQYALAG